MKMHKQQEGQKLKRLKEEVTGEPGPRGARRVRTNRLAGQCVSQRPDGEGGRHWGSSEPPGSSQAGFDFSVKEKLRLPAENK